MFVLNYISVIEQNEPLSFRKQQLNNVPYQSLHN